MIPVITEEQQRLFKDDGFFILEDVFTQAEMDALNAAYRSVSAAA